MATFNIRTLTLKHTTLNMERRLLMPAKSAGNVLSMLRMVLQTVDEVFGCQLADAHLMNGCEQWKPSQQTTNKNNQLSVYTRV